MKTFKEHITSINESSTEDSVADKLAIAMDALNGAMKIAKKLKDGKRFEQTINPLASELEEEIMFVQKGEYS